MPARCRPLERDRLPAEPPEWTGGGLFGGRFNFRTWSLPADRRRQPLPIRRRPSARRRHRVYLVSRCRVCFLQKRQYLLNSSLSGVVRLFLVVV